MIDLDVHLPGIVLGSEPAFASWLAGAEWPLRRSLRRFAASVDAESIVQEALLRIWQVARRCRPDGQPNSLLRLAVRIAHNLALDEIRRQRGAAPGVVGPGAAAAGRGLDPPPSPADPIDPEAPPDPILRRQIARCLERLAGPPRRALILRLESAGLRTDRDLAGLARMRVNTFLQNVTRARRLLARCLENAGVKVPA